MVRVVGARADAGLAVLGAVSRVLGLGEASVTANAGEGLRGDAAGALDQVDDHSVALNCECVVVVTVRSSQFPVDTYAQLTYS